MNVTSTEFALLQTFFESPGTVLTRDTLAERVLERKFSPFDRSIDLHVSNLRRKLGPQMDGTYCIRSVRGIGYLYIWPAEQVVTGGRLAEGLRIEIPAGIGTAALVLLAMFAGRKSASEH